MNPTALITGSSRGIGAATAIRLAKDGYDICINYHTNRAEAEQVAQKAEDLGVRAVPIQADVSVESDVKEPAKNKTC